MFPFPLAFSNKNRQHLEENQLTMSFLHANLNQLAPILMILCKHFTSWTLKFLSLQTFVKLSHDLFFLLVPVLVKILHMLKINLSNIFALIGCILNGAMENKSRIDLQGLWEGALAVTSIKIRWQEETSYKPTTQ